MTTRFPMTVEGAQKLRDELDQLKSVERPKVIQAISEARGHGDLSENAEYHAAKEQQSFVEGRIQEVESKLANAQIIDVTLMSNNGTVIFGSTVELMNLDNDEQVTYQIVGDDEADLKENKISVNSPIARAIIRRSQGEEVVVQTPSGEVEYEVNQVQYI